jgi:hypothetical protein
MHVHDSSIQTSEYERHEGTRLPKQLIPNRVGSSDVKAITSMVRFGLKPCSITHCVASSRQILQSLFDIILHCEHAQKLVHAFRQVKSCCGLRKLTACFKAATAAMPPITPTVPSYMPERGMASVCEPVATDFRCFSVPHHVAYMFPIASSLHAHIQTLPRTHVATACTCRHTNMQTYTPRHQNYISKKVCPSFDV